MAPQTIADRYQLEQSIGRGGMGTVWLARDHRLDRGVAIKQIGTLPGETAPDLARALREARSSAALSHPHVVSIYDVLEEGDHIWLVMEYVPSRTLWQMITQDGPLSPQATAGIGAQIADGLAAAHAVGTIHRDVKPSNILVTADQVAKISDFGIARARDQGQLTSTGLVIGTPEYFSPQLARGEDPRPADDVWALGATLYTAVEGHPPYPHQRSALALLATIASTPPPRAQSAGFLTDPIGRMLDPDAELRWSMGEAAHMLRRVHERNARDLTGLSTSALPVQRDRVDAVSAAPAGAAALPDDRARNDGRRPADVRKRRPTGGGLLLAGLTGLLALALVGGFLLFRQHAADQPSAANHGSGSATKRTHHSRSGHQTAPGSTNPTSQPPTTLPTSTPTTGSSNDTPVRTSHRLTGASAQQFVREYYAALPSDTRTAWAALSPGFQDEIGGYSNYQGFWSTISAVSVRRTTTGASNAVDASLTYTTNGGSVENEVRRLYIEREGAGYLITGDAVVG
jgi:eukaryotic-like serine/threonine-protein kinase